MVENVCEGVTRMGVHGGGPFVSTYSSQHCFAYHISIQTACLLRSALEVFHAHLLL